MQATLTLVAGPPAFSRLHARALPQKDQLCGPFWGALALKAAGRGEGLADDAAQEIVARRAGTRLALGDPRSWLPPGAAPRDDYVLPIPAGAPEGAGTSARALARAVEELAEGALAALPVAGPWTAKRTGHLLRAVAAGAPEAIVIANLRTGRLWGSRAPAPILLEHLAGRVVETPPPPEWDVGHFVTLVAVTSSPVASLVTVRDTYPSLGWGGYHQQPASCVADALERGDGHEGGILCVCAHDAAGSLRSRLTDAGFDLRHWDNGTPDQELEATRANARTE